MSQTRSLNVSINDARDRERYLTCLSKLTKVMDVVQSEEYSVKPSKHQDKLKATLMKQIEKTLTDAGLKIFVETLFRMMIVPFQNKDNPFVVKLIDFFFAILADGRWDQEDLQGCSPNDTLMSNSVNSSVLEDGMTESLPMRVLRLCERYHQEARPIVRLRIMQTVASIIPLRIQPSTIRKSLRVKLIKMLLIRIKDKSEQVRCVSAKTLCDFFEENVPYKQQIITALLTNMRYDPEHSVRAKVVSCIPLNDETMEFVVERTGDPHPVVRTAAIKRTSESIKLASLTSEMREAILKANITDTTPKNVENAISELLESWLNDLNNDPCEFLRILNVRKRTSLCCTALDSLYNQPPEDAFEKMRSPLLNDKQYPEESLCIESTFLWLYLYKRFKDVPYVYNKLALPVNEMIDYINEYVDVVEEEGDLPPGDLEYRSWMLGDMLQILAFLPIEEGGRKATLDYLPALCMKKKLMDERNSTLVVKLISVCSNIHEENTVIDLVNCLLDGDRPSTRKSHCGTSKTTSETRLQNSEADDFEHEKRLRINLGNLVHKRSKLERSRDLAVREDDLYKAQECQNEIDSLEVEVRKIKESIEEYKRERSDNLNGTVTDPNETMEEEEQWTYSDKTLRIVLSLVKTNILFRNKISDFTRTFYEMYAVKSVPRSKDPKVRALALELMCIVAIEFEEECSRTALYCLMALLKDVIEVKMTALKGLYDLVLRYSFAKLGAYEQIQKVLMGSETFKDMPKIQINADDPASTLKSLLLTYIRHEEIRLVRVSVAGVLKLLFKKEMNSSRLITTFLINWAIPSQDAQIRFKDVGTMIPVYATVGVTEANEVAQCLINCVRKCILKIHSRAPGDELIPHPDIDKIITLVVKCTDPTKLSEFPNCYVPHESIANGALQTLAIEDLTSEERMIYAKLLKVLNLRQCPAESLNRMIHSVSEISEFSNKTISQILTGFSAHLESLLEEMGSPVVNEGSRVEASAGFNSDPEDMETDE